MGKHLYRHTTITKPAILIGRKGIAVPPDEVELMASIGCTDREIAQYFGIDDQSMRHNFQDQLIQGRMNLKNSLRRAQLRVALDGQPSMLIWLGKNILNQTDQPQGTEDTKPLPWTDEDEKEEFIEDLEDELEELEQQDIKDPTE